MVEQSARDFAAANRLVDELKATSLYDRVVSTRFRVGPRDQRQHAYIVRAYVKQDLITGESP